MNNYNQDMVRLANKEEAEEIYQLVTRAFEKYGQNIEQTMHLEETLSEVIADIEDHLVLVLEKKGQLVATLRLEQKEKNIFLLRRFAVDPDFQGHGYGSLLFQAAENLVKKKGGKKIYLFSSLENNRLVKFYQKLNFNCSQINTEKGYHRGLWEKKL